MPFSKPELLSAAFPVYDKERLLRPSLFQIELLTAVLPTDYKERLPKHQAFPKNTAGDFQQLVSFNSFFAGHKIALLNTKPFPNTAAEFQQLFC